MMKPVALLGLVFRFITWGIMGSRFYRSCWPISNSFWLRITDIIPSLSGALAVAALSVPLTAQVLLKPTQPGESITLLPSDMAALESDEARRDLPCTVTQRKTELGFDLRFHSVYDVNIPMKELVGSGQIISIVFRIYPKDDKSRSSFFVQHFRVPEITDEAKGEATLQGSLDVGEGKYHVDWLARDRDERVCSSSWDLEASLSPKDKPMPHFIGPNNVS